MGQQKQKDKKEVNKSSPPHSPDFSRGVRRGNIKNSK